MSIDTAALRAKLRVYDQTLPRCQKRIVRVSNHAPDYVAEEERAEWEMRLTYPCGELEGHEGQCREGRAILGWPGFKTMTALLDEIERLRAELGQATSEAFDLGVKSGEGRERAAVVAWLRQPSEHPDPTRTITMRADEWAKRVDANADFIESGGHRNEEE